MTLDTHDREVSDAYLQWLHSFASEGRWRKLPESVYLLPRQIRILTIEKLLDHRQGEIFYDYWRLVLGQGNGPYFSLLAIKGLGITSVRQIVNSFGDAGIRLHPKVSDS